MALTPGFRLGPYEIVSALGEGGMGEVWRATDTKLKREVAIKVLPASVARDAERLARFQREAEVLASLNHPHIAHIHGLEESDGRKALVMELVEGSTLADRIAEGPIPVEEALPVARQIAEALEAAHEQGIIHRDLKPANIKVRDDGTVKVLDFGLAKAMETGAGSRESGAGHALANSPTITSPAMTEVGMILGTAAYMSPEQARGKPVDRRADIWAFGCVLYEMLTGRRAFGGEDVADTLGNVMKMEPDWAALSDAIAPRVRQVVRACLQKNPKQRLDSAQAVRLVLEGAFETERPLAEAMSGATRPAWRSPTALVGLAGVLLAIATGVTVWSLRSPAPAPPTRFTVGSPTVTPGEDAAISPDGRTVAFVGRGDGGEQVYLRRLDRLEATPLGGTEGGLPEAFSPDGQWLLLFDSQGMLVKVPLNGGPAVTVTADRNAGVTWGPDDRLVLGSTEGLWTVPAEGGEARQLTMVADGEAGHFEPHVLPNGRAVLFYVFSGERDGGQVALFDFESGERRLLFPGTTPKFADGYLVFWREGALWAVAFDPDRLEARGAPRPVVEDVRANPAGFARYSLAPNGTLAYSHSPGGAPSAPGNRAFVWVDRQGNEDPVAAEPRGYVGVRLSPDERQVLTQVRRPNADIVIYDLERRTTTPVTFDADLDLFPVWTPDGGRVVFGCYRSGSAGFCARSASGTGPVERLAADNVISSPRAWSFSPDGTTLVVATRPAGRHYDLRALTMGGDGRTRALLQTDFNETEAQLSPDGRWMAYTSDESGRYEVYVRPFPDVDAARWRISTEGGQQPLWRPDGRELFYLRGNGASIQVLAVPVQPEPRFTPGLPGVLFEKSWEGYQLVDRPRPYDVTSDGRRFLMLEPEKAAEAQTEPADIGLVVVEHWIEEVRRLVPRN